MNSSPRWSAPGARRWAGVGLMAMSLAGCGGRQPQAAACQHFVACVKELDAQRSMSTNVVRFEASGGCWGSPEGAELCTKACTRGLEVIRRAAPVPAGCAPRGAER